MRIILLISLVLNAALLAGFYAFVLHEKAQMWVQVRGEFSPEVRHALSRELQLLQTDIKALERQEARARKALLKIIGGDNYSQEKYQAAIERFERARAGVSLRKSEHYATLLEGLSKKDRERLAEHLIRHYEGADQVLKIDSANDVSNGKSQAWWDFTRYTRPKPAVKPNHDSK